MKKDFTKKQLQYYYDTSMGLWCIDKNPKDIDIEWIRKHAFQLKPISKDDKVPERITNHKHL